MNTTSVSLLHRLKTDERDVAWRRFVELYAPLIYHWIRRTGLSDADAADCAQDVLAALVVKMPAFRYDPQQSFRSWLRTLTVNKCRDVMRRNAAAVNQTVAIEPADALAPDGTELFTDQEYRQALVHRALELLQSEFSSVTVRACWEHVVSGDSAAAIAERLGITENAVYLAKSRVLRRLRAELDGLLD